MTVSTGTADTPPEILACEGGVTIAYHHSPGQTPGVIFLGGFMSDMTGTKATTLESYFRDQGRAFTRMDYQGHGQSSGRFADGTIGLWSEDAIAVLDQVTEGPQVLVGSSMGGWIMLLVALARRERIKGLVGIAPAPDFVLRMWDKFSDEQRQALERDGVFYEPSEYSEEPYAITMKLIEDGRDHLLLDKPIALDCPVRLLQGIRDPDVPWQTSLQLSDALAGTDVRVTLVKDGDHRLSTDADLQLLCRTVDDLCQQVG
jgi:pimeloyl-ACP methyl ester carboxylesterase